MKRPAEKLSGLVLERGWKVGRILEPDPKSSGGNFSFSYEVSDSSGKKALLKALDFTRALREPDFVDALRAMTSAYVFERDLLRECRDRNMDRIVRAVDDGAVQVDPSDLGKVPYLIFEMADRDLRKQLDYMGQVELAWELRSLHHMATGLQQLHSTQAAHQDLKPSNVLVFQDKVSKLGDLGSSARRGVASPRDHWEVPGDPAYAPPELLYGHINSDWTERRFGTDLYLLGSMISYFFANIGTTALIEAELIEAHSWRNWQGTYSEVLPYLHEAFAKVVDKVMSEVPNREVATELEVIFSQLCNPDPNKRGVPRFIRGLSPRYDVQRYISRFNYLARRLELGLIK